MDYVYLDNAATTKPDPEVIEEMDKYREKWFGVPSSQYGHTFDLKALEAVQEAREKVAKAINLKEGNLIFTSGATESNNTVLKGVAKQAGEGHLVTSNIEHISVLKTVEKLQNHGFGLTKVEVSDKGIIDPLNVERAIKDETLLVSIKHANNEIGSIQNLQKIGKICREKDVLFHTDAAASFTKIGLDVEKQNLDFVSFSGNQIHGPKGVGALYVRDKKTFKRLMEGGDEEMGFRPGTMNVPGIVGFGKAVEKGAQTSYSEVKKLRDKLIKGILKIEKTSLNGSRKNRLPNNVNASFLNVEGESMLLHLDMRGIAVSTGSACYSQKLEPSHVLSAIGISPERSHGSLRLTLSKLNTEKEINYALEKLREVVGQLREISAFGG